MIRFLEYTDIDLVNKLVDDKNYKIDKNELNKQAYVYIENNKIIAFVSFVISYERAELYYIFVDNEYRRNHVASKLMEYMIDVCSKKDVETIDLEVKSTNEIAINLYKKYGFDVVNVRKKYYNGIDAYLMLKRIR